MVPPAPEPGPAADPEPEPGEEWGPVDRILFECLETGGADPTAAVAAACRAHPEHQDELRRRFAALGAAGLATPPPAPRDRIPERIGEFRLLRLLGGGGMGVVYEAVQESLGRQVALKLIRPEHLYFPGQRERFRREAEAIARLSHPGIVPVFVTGVEADVPFLAMEKVDGLTLAEVLAALAGRSAASLSGADLERVMAERLPPAGREPGSERAFAGTWSETCLRIAHQVALALAHAHARGVLHRDVKPSNVMLTASGRARLLDFGLAWQEGSSPLTLSGSTLGSLPYLPPEQLRHGARAFDRRGDVYGLGVTLYELLALVPPFGGDDSEAVRRAIAAGSAPPVRARNPAVPRDTATVCAVAMDPDPARRYADADALAADLQAALEGRPLRARPLALWARTLRLLRAAMRRPAVAAMVALCAGAAILLLVMFATGRAPAWGPIPGGLVRPAFDDRELSVPVPWRWLPDASEAEIRAALAAGHRAIDIELVAPAAQPRFSAVLVRNQGPYERPSAWRVGLDEAELARVIQETGMRPIALEPYTDGERLRFSAVLVGDPPGESHRTTVVVARDRKELQDACARHRARPLDVDRCEVLGKDVWTAILLENAGVDHREWQWLENLTVDEALRHFRATNLRLHTVEAVSHGRVDAVFLADEAYEYWWVIVGVTPEQLLASTGRYGGRIVDLAVGPPLPDDKFLVALLRNNQDSLGTRVGTHLRDGTTGNCGALLQSVGRGTLVAFQEELPFEPAGALSLLIVAHALRQAELGRLDLSAEVTVGLGGSTPCPQPATPRRQPLEAVLGTLLAGTDHACAESLRRTFGDQALLETARELGLTGVRLVHPIGCPSPTRNGLTLADGARLLQYLRARLLDGPAERTRLAPRVELSTCFDLSAELQRLAQEQGIDEPTADAFRAGVRVLLQRGRHQEGEPPATSLCALACLRLPLAPGQDTFADYVVCVFLADEPDLMAARDAIGAAFLALVRDACGAAMREYAQAAAATSRPK